MRYEKLSNLCEIIIGRTPARKESKYWGKGNKWVSISDLQDKYILHTKEEITNYAIEKTRCRKIAKGTLLFSFKLTIGKMAFSACDLYTNEAIAALPVKDKRILFSPYLYYALSVANLSGSNQAAMGKTLNSKSLAEIKIPLPPLNDQKRIAFLLEKIEGMIAQRKYQLNQLDELLKSVFLEMFSQKNEEYINWPVVEIKDVVAPHRGAMRTGPFGSNLLHSEFVDNGEIAVLGIDNAVNNKFEWGEKRFITKEKYEELKNYTIFPDDVIITIMGTFGRSAVIPDDISLAINTKHLAAITVNKEIINPVFLSYSIHSNPYIINQFKSKNRGAIMSGLNLTIIKETKFPRPPIELQNKFATIVEKVESLKVKYQESLSGLEKLYGALSQKAFKGELDLSRVPLVEDKNNTPSNEVEQTEKNKKIMQEIELCNLIKQEFNDKLFTAEDIMKITKLPYESNEETSLNLIDDYGKSKLFKDFLFAAVNKHFKGQLELEQVFTENPEKINLSKKVYLKVKL